MKGWLILITIACIAIAILLTGINAGIQYSESIITKSTITVSSVSTSNDWSHGGEYSVIETVGGNGLGFWGDITSQIQPGKVYEITYHVKYHNMINMLELTNATYLYSLTEGTK
jgi:hypothetical protein